MLDCRYERIILEVAQKKLDAEISKKKYELANLTACTDKINELVELSKDSNLHYISDNEYKEMLTSNVDIMQELAKNLMLNEKE